MNVKKKRLQILIVNSVLFTILVFCLFYREQLNQRYFIWTQSVDIIMLGDSHTASGKWYNAISNRSVLKLGWDGYTTKMLVDKISQPIVFEPEYVFILCGGNDTYYDSFDVDQTIHNYKQMADTLRSHNIKPVFQKLLYRHNDPVFNTRIDSINYALKLFCFKEKIDHIDIGKGMYDGTGLKASLTTDGLHLNKQGYALWIKEVNNYLDSN